MYDSYISHKAWWRHNTYYRVIIHITWLCDIEKNIKDSGTDDVIQYGKSMLVLWSVHRLEDRLVIVCIQTTVYSI